MLSRIRDYCSTSLWLVPGLCGLFGCILAVFFLYFDVTHPQFLEDVAWLNDLDSNIAAVTLSTMLGAIITVF